MLAAIPSPARERGKGPRGFRAQGRIAIIHPCGAGGREERAVATLEKQTADRQQFKSPLLLFGPPRSQGTVLKGREIYGCNKLLAPRGCNLFTDCPSPACARAG